MFLTIPNGLQRATLQRAQASLADEIASWRSLMRG
jgi:hypothetical protein